MKKQIVILVFLLLQSLLYARNLKHFVGKIGDSFDIYMRLEVEAGKVSGYYQYLNHGNMLILRGEVKNSSITLKEFVDDKQTGEFAGSIDGDVIFGGWSNAQKVYPFRLNEIASSSCHSIEVEDVLSVDLYYPYFHSAKQVNKLLLDEASHDMAATFVDFSQNYSGQTISNWMGCSYWQDYDLHFYNDNVISVRLDNSVYTGGAHGFHFSYSRNFLKEPDDYRIFALAEVFVDNADYMSILNRVLIKELKKKGASDIVNGVKTAIVESDLGCWTVGYKGLRFYFSDYSIGSYAEGQFEAIVDYKEIDDILTDDFKRSIGRVD